jgi:hypothetical protein
MVFAGTPLCLDNSPIFIANYLPAVRMAHPNIAAPAHNFA